MRINIDSLTPIKVARHYDGAADVIEFDVGRWTEAYPALTEYRVEVTSPGGVVYLPEAVDLDGHTLKWTIMPSDTGTAGDGEYQIVAAGPNGERKTSASARFVVREIMAGTAGETPPDPAQPWVDEVVRAAQKVEDATVHPPIIGNNGNWWLWDFDAAAYVDSGKSSQGSGSGGGGIVEETDPTVPAWAKQPNPPTYTAQDVGARPADWLPTLNEINAQPAGNYALKSEIPAVPVQSVNGKTGAIELTAEDVGAASKESVDRLNEEIVEQGKSKADQFTVGDGLTMSEDRVLSAKPEAIEEIIRTITLADEREIVIDAFETGESLSLESAMIDVNASKVNEFSTTIKYTGNNYIESHTISTSGSNAYTASGIFKNNGAWDVEQFASGSAGRYGAIYVVRNPNRTNVRTTPAITSIQLTINKEGSAGTVVTIKGVRTNA